MTKEQTTAPLPLVKKEVVELSRANLAKDKKDGLTVPEMAVKYGLTKNQMTKACKLAGILERAKSKPKFVITD